MSWRTAGTGEHRLRGGREGRRDRRGPGATGPRRPDAGVDRGEPLVGRRRRRQRRPGASQLRRRTGRGADLRRITLRSGRLDEGSRGSNVARAGERGTRLRAGRNGTRIRRQRAPPRHDGGVRCRARRPSGRLRGLRPATRRLARRASAPGPRLAPLAPDQAAGDGFESGPFRGVVQGLELDVFVHAAQSVQ